MLLYTNSSRLPDGKVENDVAFPTFHTGTATTELS
jgi:hypothetical protein